MKAKASAMLGLKVIVLTLLLFVSFSIAARMAGLTDFAQTADLRGSIVALLAMCALDTIVLSYPILRSRWTGWRLVATIFFVFYGAMTFMSQIETVVFLRYLVDVVPAEMIPRLFLHGAITAAIFSPLAVLILGRMKESADAGMPDQRPAASLDYGQDRPWGGWAWRLALVAVIYVVVYIGFGALVFKPLAGAAFQQYYGNLRLPGWILPFQALRGLMWAALALPVIWMMKGRRWEAGLAVALLFSVLMASNLLVPTDIMPNAIRMAHLVEVASSNFLFGWIVVWLLAPRQSEQGATR